MRMQLDGLDEETEHGTEGDLPPHLGAGWHEVVLQLLGTSTNSAMARQGPFPTADFGTCCACCDRETTSRMSYDPSVLRTAISVSVPRCSDCAPHLETYNPAKGIVFVGLVATTLLGLGAKYGVVFSVLGVVSAAVLITRVATRRVRRARLESCGHHSGIELVAKPFALVVRSTNQRFIADVRKRNRELVRRRLGGAIAPSLPHEEIEPRGSEASKAPPAESNT